MIDFKPNGICVVPYKSENSCMYYFLIYFNPNGISFGGKSIGNMYFVCLNGIPALLSLHSSLIFHSLPSPVHSNT